MREEVVYWLPEGPTTSAGPLYARDPAKPYSGEGILGTVSTLDPWTARWFENHTQCAAWCAANPSPAWKPVEHLFVYRTG